MMCASDVLTEALKCSVDNEDKGKENKAQCHVSKDKARHYLRSPAITFPHAPLGSRNFDASLDRQLK
ncbi:hypothetical protein E2C01_022494 [Portunus trituberculatus]|uniref:Uncharacterized protein n=1 Tax=Portunus trituberculatus TaxID=210409 RepID=A0A5B7E5H3_PORTR|nr:hypothetical protein [Portunus trituberculatus]